MATFRRTDHVKPTDDEIATLFEYHPPKGNQAEKYDHLRKQFRKLAKDIIANVPAGPELDVCMQKLSELMFWSSAAIARGEP